VRAVVDFVARHTNITGGITFHTYSGVLLRPFSHQSDEAFPAEDLWTYQKIGEKGTEITGYPNISATDGNVIRPPGAQKSLTMALGFDSYLRKIIRRIEFKVRESNFATL
jgi:hypothetical protein